MKIDRFLHSDNFRLNIYKVEWRYVAIHDVLMIFHWMLRIDSSHLYSDTVMCSYAEWGDASNLWTHTLYICTHSLDNEKVWLLCAFAYGQSKRLRWLCCRCIPWMSSDRVSLLCEFACVLSSISFLWLNNHSWRLCSDRAVRRSASSGEPSTPKTQNMNNCNLEKYNGNLWCLCVFSYGPSVSWLSWLRRDSRGTCTCIFALDREFLNDTLDLILWMLWMSRKETSSGTLPFHSQTSFD